MKKILAIVLLLGAAAFALAEEFSMDQARRIDDFLARIAKRRSQTIFLKKVTFREDELNSYLNLIYNKKYAPEVSYVRLKLSNKNFVSGTLKIKLDGKKYSAVPEFLRNVELRFKGKVESANYRMRFLFEELYVNNTRFSPEMLDGVFITAQVGAKVKRSIYDWFTLLPGLKDVILTDGAITFLY